MNRELFDHGIQNEVELGAGLTVEMIREGAAFAYQMVDTIDSTLIDSGSPRLSGLVELANLSSILGNLLAAGIVQVSEGVYMRAGPHKYQDLRASGLDPSAEHIEIKVALESNTPKGHLAKPGYYLTCRYVLGDELADYARGERGDVIWIWEIRFGYLHEYHFNTSNTPGDSGKTANVNQAGMKELQIVYADLGRCPYGPRSRYRHELENRVG